MCLLNVVCVCMCSVRNMYTYICDILKKSGFVSSLANNSDMLIDNHHTGKQFILSMTLDASRI